MAYINTTLISYKGCPCPITSFVTIEKAITNDTTPNAPNTIGVLGINKIQNRGYGTTARVSNNSIFDRDLVKPITGVFS